MHINATVIILSHSLVSYSRSKVSICYLRNVIFGNFHSLCDHSNVSDPLNLIANLSRYSWLECIRNKF